MPPPPLNPEVQAKIAALRHAIFVCDSVRLPMYDASWHAACDRIKLSLEAAIERLENGEDMPAYSSANGNGWET